MLRPRTDGWPSVSATRRSCARALGTRSCREASASTCVPPTGTQDRKGLSYSVRFGGEAFVGKRGRQQDPQKPCGVLRTCPRGRCPRLGRRQRAQKKVLRPWGPGREAHVAPGLRLRGKKSGRGRRKEAADSGRAWSRSEGSQTRRHGENRTTRGFRKCCGPSGPSPQIPNA